MLDVKTLLPQFHQETSSPFSPYIEEEAATCSSFNSSPRQAGHKESQPLFVAFFVCGVAMLMMNVFYMCSTARL